MKVQDNLAGLEASIVPYFVLLTLNHQNHKDFGHYCVGAK